MGKILFCALAFLSATMAVSADAHQSDFKTVTGVKFPNSLSEGTDPVITAVLTRSTQNLKGFNELLPFVIAAPDQQEAGSCMYMSLTGIAEWWMARLNPELSRAPDGPVDFSERYLMNLSGSQSNDKIESWITDSVYFFNKARGTVLNRDYRFTKGWYHTNADGDRSHAARGARNAIYDEGFNWIDDTQKLVAGAKVKLPKFKRDILFADPEEDPWNTGVMPAHMVDRIKAALVKNKAPVQIVYNHFGYWHANYIVGFDDNLENQDCKFVRDFLEYAEKRPEELREEARRASDPEEREAILGRVSLARRVSERTQQAFAKGGGCHPKGVFYVRDSIYPDAEAPQYDYDPKNVGEELPYSKKIVLLEYDWIHYMANHATQILIDD
ncbi:MAG: hypothetical protein EOP11_04180 [Proteobacteria bacterium]|nr:MAG: hypothetical protein EOP11_04180 [Pseudomonadota bacterium]